MNGGVAGGAQHGGTLLQLHLLEARTGVIGVVLRSAVGEGFLPHPAQGVVDEACGFAEGIHQRRQPPSGVVAVGGGAATRLVHRQALPGGVVGVGRGSLRLGQAG